MITPKQARAESMSYAQAGVNIDAGNQLIEIIKPLARLTTRPGAISELGGFGGLFDLKSCGYHDPVLVAANDGVGTKLRVAIESNFHETIGIDLVAMSVNDLIVQGAEPLFFLDYFATGQLDISIAQQVISGISQACQSAGCALIGGETAEMPDIYHDRDYDLAGFAVGAVERDRILPRRTISPGDIILGLGSSGLHSNGFSLVRKIVERSGLTYQDLCPFSPNETLGRALLTPTFLYIKSLLPILKESIAIKGLAHITGGGLLENIPRILPENCLASIKLESFPCPAVFAWLQKIGVLEQHEMLRTFNCGIGMVAIVEKALAETVANQLKEQEDIFIIGEIKERSIKQSQIEINGDLRF